MKRLTAAVLVLAALGTPLAVAVATPPPSVDYALEARDAATQRPLLVLHGRNLHRFVDVSLRAAPGGSVLQVPDTVFEAKDSLLLGLKKDTPAGVYTLELRDRREALLEVPVTVQNGHLTPGSLKAEDLDPGFLSTLALRAETALLASKAQVAAIQYPDLSAYAMKADLAALTPLRGGRCHVSSGASIAATGGWTAIPFDQDDFDTDGCRYGAPEKLVCETAGYYLVTAKVFVPTSSYFVEVRKNGTRVGQDAAYTSVGAGSMTVSVVVPMAKGDYLECWIKANSGAAFTVAQGSEFSMVKVGE